MAAIHAICGAAFVDSVARLGTRNAFDTWLSQDLGFMAPAEGWGGLYESEAFERCAKAGALELRTILTEARGRVVAELAGWNRDPASDLFLHALAHAGALRRTSTGRWSPTASARMRLSDLVLALFATDILDRRETYVLRLCVCKTCGRISFDPALGERSGCAEHPDLVARGERQLSTWRTGPFLPTRPALR
jgi:hypothetical protein